MNQLDTLCVELTLRCPLRCVHCSANALPERREMMDAELLIRRIADLGHLEALYLSGGEPFEHTRLADIAKAATGIANEVSVYSSGVVIGLNGPEPLSEAAIQQIARVVSRVDISLYSLSPGEHDAVTGVAGSFECSLRSIRRLRLFGVPFGIHFVPVRGDDAILQVAQYAREAGAKRFHVLAVARQGRASALRIEYSPAFLSSLQLLARARLGIEVVISSQLRQQIDGSRTERDGLRPAFLDVHGHLYAHEGGRTPPNRSLRTLSESRVPELLADMA
jgi:MoaA/NifB/PqqE/SkfB family radical SAM enzyme